MKRSHNRLDFYVEVNEIPIQMKSCKHSPR